MTTTNYSIFAQSAVIEEQKGRYETAVVYWEKAARYAQRPVNQAWATSRIELNTLRHTLHKRFEQWQIDNRERKAKEREKRLLADALKNTTISE